MRADDWGLIVASLAVAVAPLYLFGQLIRVAPEVFGPLALLLLGVVLLTIVIRVYQRVAKSEAALDASAELAAGEALDNLEFITESHHIPGWENRR